MEFKIFSDKSEILTHLHFPLAEFSADYFLESGALDG